MGPISFPAAFSESKDNTCLVTHGGIIADIMAYLFPEAGKDLYQWQSRNGHGYCLTEDGY
jgi:broad specificity phosphatase PhoE